MVVIVVFVAAAVYAAAAFATKQIHYLLYLPEHHAYA
jgi:hypothetical protein